MQFSVYLECNSMDQVVAKNGATQVLKAIGREWFQHTELLIEEKYSTLLQ